ncbi:hypothetical protein EZV62_000574 [Acer yangbiense]|uniref:DUF4283 domain-containing protein n=1 Tax=Acer yangbiense TaxID=1000413 RepID=A0A5C7IS18_9ROSI|nr:hypothetical protein EZV62_000574 [Acer yangbiense]
MNAEELALLCSALTVKEREGPTRILDTKLKDKGEQRLSLCLVGKVLTTKLVNRVAFMDVMTSIWRVSKGVEFEGVEDNIFAFQFKNMEDRQRIIAGGPWSFDRAMIIFEEPTEDGDVVNMTFSDDQALSSEANLRLNAWLRTGSPPKRYSSGKKNTVEDDRSNERWRKECQRPFQKKVEGRIEPAQSCMGIDKTIIATLGKSVPGVKSYGGTSVEKQKELIKADVKENEDGLGIQCQADETECNENMVALLGLVSPIGPSNCVMESKKDSCPEMMRVEMDLDNAKSGLIT